MQGLLVIIMNSRSLILIAALLSLAACNKSKGIINQITFKESCDVVQMMDGTFNAVHHISSASLYTAKSTNKKEAQSLCYQFLNIETPGGVVVETIQAEGN